MDRPRQWAIAMIGVVLLVAACTGSGAQAPIQEDLLARAGFVQRSADNPDRLAALKALPPHQFVMRNSNGSIKYLYADPTVCGCIYVGGQRAYDQYRQMMASQVSGARIRAILSTTNLPGESGL